MLFEALLGNRRKKITTNELEVRSVFMALYLIVPDAINVENAHAIYATRMQDAINIENTHVVYAIKEST